MKRLTAERIGKLRGVLRVARTYLSKKTPRHAEPWVALSGYSKKAWRRAYVETCLTVRPAECVITDGIAVLEVMGEARAVAACGRVLSVKRLGTDPATIAMLSQQVGDRFFSRVASRLHELEPEVALRQLGAPHASSPLLSLKIRWARPFVIGAMKRFLAQVDPEALRIARRFWLTSPECLAWLTPSNPELAKRRRQAVELYPALMLHARPWESGQCASLVCRAIDGAAPLVEALARTYQVRPATIRWFAGRSPQSLFRRLASLKERLPMRALDLLPAQLMPSCRADMEAAMRLDDLLTAFGGRVDEHRQPFGALSDQEQQFDVRAFMKRIPCSIPLREQPVISSYTHTQQVKDTIYDAKGSTKDAIARLSTMGLSALDKLATDWHRAVVLKSAEDVSHAEWEPGLEGLDIEEGDLRLVELTTSAQLAGEGVFLSHCVGTYAPRCLKGYSRIISVRNALGMPLSTIEISSAGRIVQHCGYRNTTPSAPELKLAKRLSAEIRAEKVKIKIWPSLETAHRTPYRLDMSAFWSAKGLEVDALETEDCPF